MPRPPPPKKNRENPNNSSISQQSLNKFSFTLLKRGPKASIDNTVVNNYFHTAALLPYSQLPQKDYFLSTTDTLKYW